ncbi:MAG: Tlg2-vesicle protein [Sclerophora amabilis]|nr:MAG: Tlg2-vesicle protein [Sclerophora amabilis]
MGMLFLVYNERIFAWLAPVAKKWRDLPAGWLIIFAMTFICAFPPVIGYSTTLTIAGFVYGFPIGWFIVASATVVGSFCAFLTSRTIFSTYAQRLVANDTRFNALALTLKHDGLKLLIMIRYCPLPYSLSNGAMSTFPTVHPLMFTLATAISTPRAIIPIFIGGRLAQLAEKGEKMDAKTKAINYASIAIGGLIGLAVGWFIYQRTVARSRQLEAQERAGLAEQRNSASGGHFLDEPEDDINEANLRGADDISLFENFPEEEAFHDESSDEQEVVHDHRKRDEEELIGMDRDPANTGT